MNGWHMELRDTATLEAPTRCAVASVFAQAFTLQNSAEACLIPYFTRVRQIWIARRWGTLVAFQFYQRLTVDRYDVHHFSLAAKLPSPAGRGVQARFGRFLIGRFAWRTAPWRPVLLAGVTNNIRSYANMYGVGCTVYPDVLRPSCQNPFGDLYQRVGEALGFISLDARGVLRNRTQGMGFDLIQDLGADHPLGAAYAKRPLRNTYNNSA